MSNGNLSLLRFAASLCRFGVPFGPLLVPRNCLHAANIQQHRVHGLYEGMDGKLLEHWTSHGHQFYSHRKGSATVWDADLLTVRDGRNMYIYTALIL